MALPPPPDPSLPPKRPVPDVPLLPNPQPGDWLLGTSDPEGTPETVNIEIATLPFVSVGADGPVVGVIPVTLVTSQASSATPSINVDGALVRRVHEITALATNITGITITGTPYAWQMLALRITATGSTRSIARGASFADGLAEMAASVAAGDTLLELYRYDGAEWRCLASGLEA